MLRRAPRTFPSVTFPFWLLSLTVLVILWGALFAAAPVAHAQTPTAATSSTETPVTITVGGAYASWGIPDRNSTSPPERAKRAVFDAFSKSHPDIRLARYSSLRISGPAAESGIIMAYAGGTAPDIIYVNFRLMRQYADQGFLRPLDDLVAQDPQSLSRVQPAVLKELRGDGHIYSVPSAQFVQALYYRKDLFRAAGLNPNKPPTTWDEFYADAQALTDQDKGQWGFVFPNDESYWWINFLWQAGGEITQLDPKSGEKLAAFNSPAGIAALEFYRKLILGEWKDKSGKTRKGIAQTSSTLKQDISAGKVGMWFAYQSDDVANMNQFDLNPSLIGIAPMPKGPTGVSANEINASMWGINASVKDPKKLAACWEFIKFMASDEAARVRTTAYVENGLGQLVNPVELKKWGFEEFITAQQRPWLQANKFLFTHGKPEPNGKNMAFIYTLMNEPLDQAILYPDRPAQQILDTSVSKINTKLLGYISPTEKARNTGIVLVVLAFLFGGITYTLTKTLIGIAREMRLRREALAKDTDTLAATRIRGGAPRLPLRVHLTAAAMMAPALVSIAVWAYLPLLRGLVMAFQDVRILGGSRWIGLDNFVEAVGQETFQRGLVNSVFFTFYLLGLGFFLPVILALLLNEIPKGKILFRVLYYLPAVTTGIVVALLFKQFWDPTPNGFANQLLAPFDPILRFLPGWHTGPHKWLQDPNEAMFAVVLPLIWAGAGPGCIIYLAALQGIPDEMYEAADLDGAGFFTKIFRITLPTLSPLIIINLVGATVGAFKIMEPVLVQTGGGPDNATYTIGLEIWYNAFLYLKFGYATAAAILMGLLLIGLTMYQLRVLQNVRFAAGNR